MPTSLCLVRDSSSAYGHKSTSKSREGIGHVSQQSSASVLWHTAKRTQGQAGLEPTWLRRELASNSDNVPFWELLRRANGCLDQKATMRESEQLPTYEPLGIAFVNGMVAIMDTRSA